MLLMVMLSSYTTVSNPAKNTINYQLSVSTTGTDFDTAVQKLYQTIDWSCAPMDMTVFKKALNGYLFLKQTNELKKEQFLTVLDFSKQSNQRRLWIIDLKSKQLIFNELVAHGKNSGDKFATSFSNNSESQKSSLGFYTTGETYNGKHRYSLKLNGLESGFNSNAFSRGIVMHGADYVSQEIAEAQQSVGRSFGCPAVSQEVIRPIVDIISGGSCFFIYHPDADYNEKSKILNNSLYIPIELLNNLID